MTEPEVIHADKVAGQIYDLLQLDLAEAELRLAAMTEEERQAINQRMEEAHKRKMKLEAIEKFQVRARKVVDKNFAPSLNRAERRKQAKKYRKHKEKEYADQQRRGNSSPGNVQRASGGNISDIQDPRKDNGTGPSSTDGDGGRGTADAQS